MLFVRKFILLDSLAITIEIYIIEIGRKAQVRPTCSRLEKI
jgi:hypothetical protein